MVKFEISPLFLQTYQAKTRGGHGAVAKKFEEFRAIKSAHPNQSWGANDRPMKSGGLFSNEIPGVRKAHLTHDISVVYTVSGINPTMIRLYGLFDHDDLGVGSPPNINRQKSMSKTLASQRFGGEEMFPSAPEPQRTKPQQTSTSGTRPDYTPRPRPSAEPAKPNPVVALTQQIDSAWPQRNFANRFADARERNEQLAIINSEVNYLQQIASRNRLYPNQQDYARGLQQLYAKITGR